MLTLRQNDITTPSTMAFRAIKTSIRTLTIMAFSKMTPSIFVKSGKRLKIFEAKCLRVSA
jgi:hypothetical protein